MKNINHKIRTYLHNHPFIAALTYGGSFTGIAAFALVLIDGLVLAGIGVVISGWINYLAWSALPKYYCYKCDEYQGTYTPYMCEKCKDEFFHI